jgi:Uma2 family endonuclease
MVAATPLLVPAPVAREVAATREDRRVTLYGVSWDQYVTISEAMPEGGGIHLTYLEGTLEIMTTGSLLEYRKKTLARLLEAYADEMHLDLEGYGSATFRKQAKERGLEPDECYVLGRKLAEGDVPDLAVEVVISHGAIDKLDVHAGLGVQEVWFWEDGVITVHVLGPDGYEKPERSRLLPDLDLAELASFVSQSSQMHAVRAYRALLRERAGARR